MRLICSSSLHWSLFKELHAELHYIRLSGDWLTDEDSFQQSFFIISHELMEFTNVGMSVKTVKWPELILTILKSWFPKILLFLKTETTRMVAVPYERSQVRYLIQGCKNIPSFLKYFLFLSRALRTASSSRMDESSTTMELKTLMFTLRMASSSKFYFHQVLDCHFWLGSIHDGLYV